MRKSGGRFGCRNYAFVSKLVSKIAQFPNGRNFESAMLTRKKRSIESIGSGPFGAENLKSAIWGDIKRQPKGARGTCHNTGIANTNRMPA